jgi:hypothetical protein
MSGSSFSISEVVGLAILVLALVDFGRRSAEGRP